MGTVQRGGGPRLLFAGEPAWGHLNPLVTLAGELNARGAGDIWFACTDERRAVIEAIGGRGPARFASLGPGKPEHESANWSDQTLAAMTTGSPLRNLAAVMDATLDHGYNRQLYLRTLEIVDEVKPALAVINLGSHWAIDAAARRGVPYVLSFPGTVSSLYAGRLPWRYPTPLSGLPKEMSRGQAVRNVLLRLGFMGIGWRPRHLRENMEFFRTRQAEGLANPAAQITRYADSAVAVLVYSVFGIEYPFPDVPGNIRMLGPVIPRDVDTKIADKNLARWLDRSESVIYAAFGTVMRLTPQQIQALLEVFGRLGPRHRVLWKLPRALHDQLPGELPPNVRVESWIPSQLAVLAHPRVRVFFNHGGDNAVHEGLYFGQPELVMPFWMDNLDNAARVVDSGAGLAVPHRHDPDPDDIAAKLARLLDEPGFRARAADWSRQLREAGGVVAAADEVTAVLDRLVGVSAAS